MVKRRLIFITDAERFGVTQTIVAARDVCQGARAGSVVLQVRDKQLSSRERLLLAHKLRALSEATGQYLVVNDRLDIAFLSRADGVHLGEASVSPAAVRARFPNWWLSCAWHSGEPRPEADAYLLSPVVAPRKGKPALGVEGLSERVRTFAGLAIYALGGVDAGSAPRCLAAGASGVAACEAAYVNSKDLLLALGIVRSERDEFQRNGG